MNPHETARNRTNPHEVKREISMTDFYPSNPSNSLRIIRDNYQEDEDYLVNSPYNEEDVKFLESLLSGFVIQDTDNSVNIFSEGSDPHKITLEQTEKLYSSISSFIFKNQGEAGMLGDTKEQTPMYRLAVQSLDKLINLRERSLNLKEYSEFQKAILAVIDDVLEPSQRTEVNKRLKDYIANE